MARFKDTDNTQGQFIAVNLKEQLLVDTFEWTIDYLINKTDLSLFEKKYNNDEKGACAYPPRVLLKIILYCYSKGIITSRRIEKACRENIIVKALAEDSEPDQEGNLRPSGSVEVHATIAAFILTNGEAVKDLFAQIIVQCAQLDLITGEMFAVDGCKLPSNASKEWSGMLKELRKKRDKLKEYIERIIKQHRELDKDEGAKEIQKPYAKTMGEGKERRERSVERLEKKLEKLNMFLKTAEPRKGVAAEEVQSNVTDNESALIKSPHGYIQGYNGIAVADSGSQIIVSAEVVGSGPESGSFPKMLDSLEENMKTELQGQIDGSLNEHQKVFDQWRKDFNEVRPHEALDMKVPADIYTKSEIKYSGENIEHRYGRGYKVRIVNDRGFMNLNQKRVFVGNPFAGYNAGVKEFVDKPTEVWFGNFLLGTINNDTGLIEPSSTIMQLTNNS